MPNIKSVQKDVKRSQRNNLRNRSGKSKVKTSLKNTRETIQNSTDQAAVQSAITSSCSVIDRTRQKGIFHPNKAARLKRRLMRDVNAISINLYTQPHVAASFNITKENLDMNPGRANSAEIARRAFRAGLEKVVANIEGIEASDLSVRDEVVSRLMRLASLYSASSKISGQSKVQLTKIQGDISDETEHLASLLHGARNGGDGGVQHVVQNVLRSL